MPRDYKRRASPKAKSRKGVPAWLFFVVGLAVGLLATLLVWLKQNPGTSPAPGPAPRPAQVKPQPKKPPVAAETRPQEEPAKPRFDFYTILPEMEVVVPEPEPEPESEPPKTVDGSEPGKVEALPAGRYMLQMGSFRRYVDADRLKASLALVGLEAEIQKVTVNDGEVFHRVRSGPYSRQQADKLRAKLQQNRIGSLVIRLK